MDFAEDFHYLLFDYFVELLFIFIHLPDAIVSLFPSKIILKGIKSLIRSCVWNIIGGLSGPIHGSYRLYRIQSYLKYRIQRKVIQISPAYPLSYWLYKALAFLKSYLMCINHIRKSPRTADFLPSYSKSLHFCFNHDVFMKCTFTFSLFTCIFIKTPVNRKSILFY